MSNVDGSSNGPDTVTSNPALDAQTQQPVQTLEHLSSAAAAARLPSPVATPEPTQSAPVAESNATAAAEPVQAQQPQEPITSVATSTNEAPLATGNLSPPKEVAALLPTAQPVSDIQDATMTDAAQDTPAVPPATTIISAQGEDASTVAARALPPPSDPQPPSDVAAVPSATEVPATPATDDHAPASHLPDSLSAHVDAPTKQEDVEMTTETTAPAKSEPVVVAKSQAPVDPEVKAAETPAEPPAEAAISAAPAASPSAVEGNKDDTSAQSASRVRSAEDALEEPSAKRTKTEETQHNDGEFKKPDLPATTQSLPPIMTTTNVISAPVNTAVSAQPRFSASPMTPVQKKILEEKIKNTKKTKHAVPFLRPVDPIALNIPNYPTIVTQPMDLSTLEQKLKGGQFGSLDDFVADFELIINNCFKFNGENHDISRNAKNLREYFRKQLESVPTGENASTPLTAAPTPKTAASVVKTQPRRESRASVSSTPVETFPLREPGVPQIRRDSTAARPQRAVVTPSGLRDLSYSIQPKKKSNQAGLKFCDHVLAELRKPKYAALTGPFLVPVDPIALKIPQYNKIIKEPMDIETITDKQRKGYFSTAEEFRADFDLMFANCFKFNPVGHPVADCGKKLQDEFNELWKEKSKWVKAHGPASQRESPASEDESEEEEEEEEDPEKDANEAQLQMLKNQLATMQSTMMNLMNGIAEIETRKKAPKPAADGNKKKKKRKSQSNGSKSAGGASSAGGSKSKASGSKSKKSAKPRKISREQAKYITDMSERMTEDQIAKLTEIITSSYTPIGEEVEIDELPAEVQQKILAWVKSLFPPAPGELDDDDDAYDGADGQRSRKASGAAGPAGTKKKRKPMKADEQMRKAEELKSKMDALQKGQMSTGSSAGGAGVATSAVSATSAGGAEGEQSSGGESDESSEEE